MFGFVLFSFLVSVLCTRDRPMQVIIDTDIGQDMDDSWAVALALKLQKELDVLMIVTAAHNTIGRAQILCQYLERVKRTDVVVGIGVKQDDYVGDLYGWAKDYDLDRFPGTLHRDGVQAMNDVILNASKSGPVYILGLAPMVNIASLIERFPDAAASLEGIIAMSGSIYKGYSGGPPAVQEYNVNECSAASEAVYNYPWKNGMMDIAPLDNTIDAYIGDYQDDYQTLIKHNNTDHPILMYLLANYCYWAAAGSTILYDPVATFMATIKPNFAAHKMIFKEMSIHVENGWTRIDEQRGVKVNEGIDWEPYGLGEWAKWVVDTLTS